MSGSTNQIIFTDGACENNGKPEALAGCGVYFGPGDPMNFSCPLPGEKQTNNRAELYALILAINFSSMDEKVVIYSDSEYCVKGITKWMRGWKRRDWKNSKGQPIKNLDLWKDIDGLINKRNGNLTFEWVKAHDGLPGNEAADQLAVAAIQDQRAKRKRAAPEKNNKKRKKKKNKKK